MSSSFTLTGTTTFTLTHAKHLAAKVATDLKRMQRLYGEPDDGRIADFEAEVIEYLKGGYLGAVTYGYRRGVNWVEPMLRYTARDLADASANDDDPGRIRPGANTSGAVFYSYLTYSPAWHYLNQSEKEAFQSRLPFQRTNATEPGINGYLIQGLTYSAGGRALDRSIVRSF